MRLLKHQWAPWWQAAGSRQQAAGALRPCRENNTGTERSALLLSSPLRCSAGTSTQLGLLNPTDPLLLIDFLIINSVCPSISLRCRISPSHAKALRGPPPSGYKPDTDLGDLNPPSAGEFGLFLVYRLHGFTSCSNEDAGCVEQTGLNRRLCVTELSNQTWPFTITDHKTKRKRAEEEWTEHRCK